MVRRLFSSIEALESRIAPAALTILNPLVDVVAGVGKTGTTVDLGQMFDAGATSAYHSHVEFMTNFDTDPNTAGVQPGRVVLELFDDTAPLTVQNFLSYVNSLDPKGDYAGTIFHRAVNQSGLQILQGGGYDINDLSTHIATGPEVHNEYSANQTNVRGTIALAKTGLSPNTGTSEFFLNMGDNSQTLGGDNNGGYTVFGRITAGLDVLDQIFAHATADVSIATKNSALGTVPYQPSYDPDPDHNLNTPSPAPTASQLYGIASARVIPAADSVSTNVRYEFSVTDHSTGAASNLLTTKLIGTDTLSLSYASGVNGIADVTVTATPVDAKGVATGSSVTDSFQVTVLPNLYAHDAITNFQPYISPGDTALARVSLTNNAGGTLHGTYDVNFYLIDTTTDAQTLVGSVAGKTLSLASGQSLDVLANVQMPATLFSDQTHRFELAAQATPSAGQSITELFPGGQSLAAHTGAGGALQPGDDNASLEPGSHLGANYFGNIVVNGQVVHSTPTFQYNDVDGHLITVGLIGAGSGQVYLDSSNQWSLRYAGTTAATTIGAIVPAGSHTSLHNVFVLPDALSNGTPVGSIVMPGVDLTGSLVATGSAQSISLGDFIVDPANPTLGHQLLLGASAALATSYPTISVGNAVDTDFHSYTPVLSFSAKSWLDTGEKNTILSPAFGTFSVQGNLQSNLTVDAAAGDSHFYNVDSASTYAVGTLKVGGSLQGSTVQIAANVGMLDLGAIESSHVTVGGQHRPTSATDFNQIRAINTFVIRGLAGQTNAFIDSDVAASRIDAAYILSGVDGASGTHSFGVVADTIGTYYRVGGGSGSNPPAGTFDPSGNYDLQVL